MQISGLSSSPMYAAPSAGGDVLQAVTQARMDMVDKMMRYAIEQQVQQNDIELDEAVYNAIDTFA